MWSVGVVETNFLRLLSRCFLRHQKQGLPLQKKTKKNFGSFRRITNFLFHSCGERHRLWFSCCLVVLSSCVSLVVFSLNITIFISSANYFVFPLWGAHEERQKQSFLRLITTSNAEASQEREEKNFKHWYKIPFDDSPTENHVMWEGIRSIIDFPYSVSQPLSTTEGKKSLLEYISVSPKRRQKIVSHNL